MKSSQVIKKLTGFVYNRIYLISCRCIAYCINLLLYSKNWEGKKKRRKQNELAWIEVGGCAFHSSLSDASKPWRCDACLMWCLACRTLYGQGLRLDSSSMLAVEHMPIWSRILPSFQRLVLFRFLNQMLFTGLGFALCFPPRLSVQYSDTQILIADSWEV